MTCLRSKRIYRQCRAVTKTLRSRSQWRRYAGEKLYVIKSFNFDGTPIYSKGAIGREEDEEIFYILVSAKISTTQ